MEEILNYRNIYFVPSFHNKLQFCLEVRKAFNEIKPDIVAVELPDIYYSEIIQAVSRLPKLTMLCINYSENEYEYIPIFPSDSMIEGIRLAKENNLPISMIDLAMENYKIFDDFIPPDDYAINSMGLSKFYEINKEYFNKKELKETKRESNMAFHLNRLSRLYTKVLFIGGMAHWENIKQFIDEKTFMFHHHEIENVETPFLAKPSQKSLAYLMSEIPYVVFHYEIARRFNLSFDKWKIILKMIEEAKQMPILEDESFNTREINNLIQYSLKLANIDNEILPDLYNLLLSAKQTLGDDYGMELLDLAKKYPFLEEEDLPIIDIDKDSFLLAGRKITLKRKLPSFSLDPKSNNQWEQLQLVRKKKDELPDDYLSEWFFFGFYSHIPEDIVLEAFIDRLENKAINELIKEPKVHEFSGSLLDGLELRETIRNHHNKKIFVKEYKKENLDVGAWLIVFDEDLSYSKYPWAMALSAEHHNESDIAFYASNPLMHPVGKQIIRAEYGALLAFKPPLPSYQKVYIEEIDVIENLRLYQLTTLAIELSEGKDIIYVSSKEIDPYFIKMANSKGKRLIHIPITRFSNRNIKKLKRFHLLKSKNTRRIADDYI
ncbi:MAG: hypothetical protein U0354_01140 [Candidatus Sericytochromatia bacterium]